MIDENESYLSELRQARDNDSVLKLDLINLRSDLPSVRIFVFEGDDDKTVYFHWLKRISADLVYEPYRVGGKKKALRLRDVLLRDENNLLEGVYFFIDRDFDDFGGFGPHGSTFMTDCYSVENYLVCPSVVEEFLKIEFNCHGKPSIRREIIGIFEKSYNEFLERTKDINFRIYLAQRLRINMGSIPDKISAIFDIELDTISRKIEDVSEIIRLDREPDGDEADIFRASFELLTPHHHYRGKFCYRFFERWLQELAKDYASVKSRHFKEIDRTSKARLQEVTMGSMAAKSRLPPGLSDFVRATKAVGEV